MAPRVLVVGGSFAGLTAAHALKKELGRDADVTVVSRQEDFVFIPSLIWVVTGKRSGKQVSFPVAPTLKRKGIGFANKRVDKIDPERKVIIAEGQEMPYDYLVLATGPKFEWSAVPGLGPDNGHTLSVCSLPHAVEAGKEFAKLLENPGPVVIGAAQGAACFGAAYEVAFNIEHALRKAGLKDRAPITFLTSEPFPGHFGLDGMGDGEELVKEFFAGRGINWISNAAIDRVESDKIVLADGRELPSSYSVIIPPFLGIDAILESPGVGNPRGFVPVNDKYQHTAYPEVYAAGVAIAAAPQTPTEIPTGVPKTGYMAEVMGHTVAKNIAAAIKGSTPHAQPFGQMAALCILDAGDSGMIIMTDSVFKPRKREWLLPGFCAHWAKLAFEKYFLWKMANGYVDLP